MLFDPFWLVYLYGFSWWNQVSYSREAKNKKHAQFMRYPNANCNFGMWFLFQKLFHHRTVALWMRLWVSLCGFAWIFVYLCLSLSLSVSAVYWCRFARLFSSKSIFLRTLNDKPLTIWLSKLMRKWSMSANAFKLRIKRGNGIFRVFLKKFLVLFVFVTINVCLIQIQCMLDSCIVDNQHRIDLCYRPHICVRLKLWDWMLIAWKAFVWSKIYLNVMNSFEIVQKTSPIFQFQESLPSTIRRKPCYVKNLVSANIIILD